MLKHLQKDMGLTYMFIAHDLSMVKYISDRIVVMYLGSVMEECSARVLYEHPLHPYTQGLLSAIPEPDPIRAKQAKDIIKGEIPSPINPKPYCKFAGRCPFVEPICRQSIPELREIEPGHLIACHLAEKMKGEKACSGLAIFVIDKTYSETEGTVSFPFEYLPLPNPGDTVDALSRAGEFICKGTIVRVKNTAKNDHTPVVTMAVPKKYCDDVRTMRRLNIPEDAEFTPEEHGCGRFRCDSRCR